MRRYCTKCTVFYDGFLCPYCHTISVNSNDNSNDNSNYNNNDNYNYNDNDNYDNNYDNAYYYNYYYNSRPQLCPRCCNTANTKFCGNCGCKMPDNNQYQCQQLQQQPQPQRQQQRQRQPRQNIHQNNNYSSPKHLTKMESKFYVAKSELTAEIINNLKFIYENDKLMIVIGQCENAEETYPNLCNEIKEILEFHKYIHIYVNVIYFAGFAENINTTNYLKNCSDNLSVHNAYFNKYTNKFIEKVQSIY